LIKSETQLKSLILLSIADRQAKLLNREKLVREGKVQGLGILADSGKLFNNDKAGKTDFAKWIILRTTINNIVARLFNNLNFSTNKTHPMREVFSSEQAPYFLIGLELSQMPKNQFGGIDSFSNFDPFKAIPSFKPDLQLVKSQFLKWVILL